MKRVWTMRQRLLLVGGLGLLLLVGLSSLLLGGLFERAVNERLDQELARNLLDVVAQLETGADGQPRLRTDRSDGRYQRVFSGDYWQLADADGNVLLQSRSLWDQELPRRLPSQMPVDGALQLDATGPLDQRLRLRVQRIGLPRAAAPLVIAVASERSALDAQVARFRWYVAGAIALLAAAWLLTLASQAVFALRPLERLAARLDAVRHGRASRIETTDLGGDIAPLADELNDLLDHHQRMVQRARSSAQDLAHALKTPLAVLSAEAAGEGTHWRQTLREQGRRMQASIDRYLASGLATDARRRCAVATVAAPLVALMQRLHGERGVHFDNRIHDAALQFAGDAADLEEMLGNLLDNAGRWAGSTVTLDARHDGGQMVIEICDDGPGLPGEALDQVTRRGVRLDERPESSGLGLAIVADIAASHGGRLVLANRTPGLGARLELPVA